MPIKSEKPELIEKCKELGVNFNSLDTIADLKDKIVEKEELNSFRNQSPIPEAIKVEESSNGSETPIAEESKSDSDKIIEMQKQIAILTKSADKTQLARHTPKDKIGCSRRVGTIDGKLVIKWELLTNVVRYDKRGDNIDQKGEFTLEDDTKVPYTLETFSDLLDKVLVDINLDKCKFIFDEKGNRGGIEEYSFTWKGKEQRLSSTFINP